jgi:hypothetical protein
MRQVDARWPGNPAPSPRILDVIGPSFLRARMAQISLLQLTHLDGSRLTRLPDISNVDQPARLSQPQ